MQQKLLINSSDEVSVKLERLKIPIHLSLIKRP